MRGVLAGLVERQSVVAKTSTSMNDHAVAERREMNKGGPATENGKEIVRWNATQHGIRSPAPVVPGIEKAEDWEAHGEGVLESLKPEGHLETVLAERCRCSPGVFTASPDTRPRVSPSTRRRRRKTWHGRGASIAGCSGMSTPRMCAGN